MKATARRIAEFRETTDKIVSLLSEKKVNVTQVGLNAYVQYNGDGSVKVVNIPMIPDTADDAVLDAIRGYIDHEVAHVLFTDPSKSTGRLFPKHGKPKILHNLSNLIEDTRIERMMQRRFPGSAANLNSTFVFVAKNFFKPAIDKAIKTSGKPDLASLIVPMLRAQAGGLAAQDFMRDYDVEALFPGEMPVFKAFQPRLVACDSTEDASRLAYDLLEALKAGKLPEEPSDGEGDEGEVSEPKKESKAKGEESKKEPKPAKEPEAKKDEPKKGDQPEEKDKSEDESKAKDEGGSEEGDESDGSETDAGDDAKDEGKDEGKDEKKSKAKEPKSKAKEPKSGDKSEDKGDDADESDAGDESGDESGDQEGEGDADADGDEGEGDAGKPEGDKGESKAKSKKGDIESGEGGDEEGEGDESDDGEGEGESESESEGGDSTGGEPDGDAKSEGPGEDGEGEENSEELIEAGAIERILDGVGAMTDGQAVLAASIKNIIKMDMKRTTYLPATLDNDRITLVEPNEAALPRIDAEAIRLDDKLRQVVGQLQAQMRRMFAQRDQVVNYGGQRRGRLQASALHRITMGDDRVFTKREEHEAEDTAITLLIDLSGSMRSGAGRHSSASKLTIACETAYAFAQILERLGIKYEVIGFTTHSDMEVNPMAVMEPGVTFTRYEPIETMVFKGFEERMTHPVRRRFIAGILHTQYESSGYGRTRIVPSNIEPRNNIDGESVMIAARRLIKRREQRKILMVLSDGAPCGGGDRLHEHLVDTVKAVEAMKIETIGIGIADRAVEHFYPKRCVVNDVATLPGVVMTEMRRLLLDKRATS